MVVGLGGQWDPRGGATGFLVDGPTGKSLEVARGEETNQTRTPPSPTPPVHGGVRELKGLGGDDYEGETFVPSTNPWETQSPLVSTRNPEVVGVVLSRRDHPSARPGCRWTDGRSEPRKEQIRVPYLEGLKWEVPVPGGEGGPGCWVVRWVSRP